MSGSDRFAIWARCARLQVWLTGLLGAGSVAIPGQLLQLFGAERGPSGQIFLRAFGVSLFFVALIHHATRDSRDAKLIRAIAIANVVEDGSLLVLTVLGIVTGTFALTGLMLAFAFVGEVWLNVWLVRRFSGD
ncbi:MAG: hypothetical protein HOV80_38935 [Polyangiaceae bacterium]|nr:hypothetical protein [Polyangiaceae bacterium]